MDNGRTDLHVFFETCGISPELKVRANVDTLEVTSYYWHVDVWIKDEYIISGVSGIGYTPRKAWENLAREISEKLLLLNLGCPNKTIVRAPKLTGK